MIEWTKKRLANKGKKIKVDSRLVAIFYSTGIFVQDDSLLSLVKKLKEMKNKHLLDEELDWRIKSRGTCIAKGDNNAKYFHNYVSFRKNKNTI